MAALAHARPGGGARPAAARLRARPELHGEADARRRRRRLPADRAAACSDGRPLRVRPGVSLTIVTSRARGPLAGTESKLAFGRAVLSNTISRDRLAAHLRARALHVRRDVSRRAVRRVRVLRRRDSTDANCEDALVASGTIPLICSPVRDIAGAPPGNYWDGALVDYHLQLPYGRLTAGRPPPAHRPLPAFQRLRDPGLAGQAPAVAPQGPQGPPVARRRAADRALARLPRLAAQSQDPGP